MSLPIVKPTRWDLAITGGFAQDRESKRAADLAKQQPQAPAPADTKK